MNEQENKEFCEQLSLKVGERIYQFGEGEDEWFTGTVDQCDNCFGLRVGASEGDVFSFAKSHNTVVLVYQNGKLVGRHTPDSLKLTA